MDKDPWRNMKDPGAPFTYHIMPVNDLVLHEFDDCVCNPEVKPHPRADGAMGFTVVHSSLDGREHAEKGTKAPPDRGDQASG